MPVIAIMMHTGIIQPRNNSKREQAGGPLTPLSQLARRSASMHPTLLLLGKCGICCKLVCVGGTITTSHLLCVDSLLVNSRVPRSDWIVS